LEVTGFFTWSKNMGTASASVPGNDTSVSFSGVYNDQFNRNQGYVISQYDEPFVLTFAPSYTVQPTKFGGDSGGAKAMQWLVRDWRIAGLFSYTSGLPILAPAATNNLNLELLRGNTVGSGTSISYASPTGQPFFLQNLNCHCFDPNTTFVLNPAAWVNPPPGQFGTASTYYTDYRQQRHPGESASLARTFRIREGISLQVRAEFTNIFNRTGLNAPTSTNAFAPQTKNGNQTTAGFGYINTAPGGGGGTNPAAGSASSLATPPPREGQLVARFTF
jgi:hypothetical protein